MWRWSTAKVSCEHIEAIHRVDFVCDLERLHGGKLCLEFVSVGAVLGRQKMDGKWKAKKSCCVRDS